MGKRDFDVSMIDHDSMNDTVKIVIHANNPAVVKYLGTSDMREIAQAIATATSDNDGNVTIVVTGLRESKRRDVFKGNNDALERCVAAAILETLHSQQTTDTENETQTLLDVFANEPTIAFSY